MVDRVATLVAWVKLKKPQLRRDWQSPEQIGLIEKVADIIRIRRNDAGHPQDPPAVLSHEEMYALLVVFPHYCEEVCSFQSWLRSQPASIT